MPEVTREMVDKVVEDLNGLQIVWIGDDEIELDSICLCTYEKGLSVKPLGTVEEVRAKFKEAGWDNSPTLAELKDPKFCLSTARVNDIVGSADYDRYLSLKKIVDTNTLDTVAEETADTIMAAMLGIVPTCPY